MEPKNSFKLIEGKFAPSEAAKVIFALINSKIKYHSLDAFSNEIRFQKQATGSIKRIEELKTANKAIRTLLDEAADKGFEVVVNSTIEISFVSQDGRIMNVSLPEGSQLENSANGLT